MKCGLIVMGDLPRNGKNMKCGLIVMGDPPRMEKMWCGLIIMGDLPLWKEYEKVVSL